MPQKYNHWYLPVIRHLRREEGANAFVLILLRENLERFFIVSASLRWIMLL